MTIIRLTAAVLLTLLNVRGAPESPGRGQAKVNGITIAYESSGPVSSQPVLLIGGTGMQLTTWPPELVQALVKQGYRVIIYDHRDSGLSTKFDSAGKPDFAAILKAVEAGQPAPLAYTVYDMASDAVGLLDALSIPKAHIAGASMGGMIAQIIAADYPERTLSLTSIMATDGKPGLPIIAKPDILSKIPPPAAEPDKAGWIERQVKVWQAIGSPGFPRSESAIRVAAARDAGRSFYPAGEARQSATSLVAAMEDRRERLRTIKAPTVVVHGAEDPLVPVEAGRDVAANIPGTDLRVIPGMGHDIPPELVEKVASAIIAAAAREPQED